MVTVGQLLRDLDAGIRSSVGGHGSVAAAGEGLDYEVRVRPQKKGACPFIIHAQSEDEISIEFGAFSVAHIASADMGAVSDTCWEIVEHLIAGNVREVVWVKSGRACRAIAYVGLGSEVTTFRTKRALCFGSECHEYQYEGYR